jgi:hypothetical protein
MCLDYYKYTLYYSYLNCYFVKSNKILNSFEGRSLTDRLMAQQQHSLNRRELFAFKKESSALKFQTYGAIANHVAAPPRAYVHVRGVRADKDGARSR